MLSSTSYSPYVVFGISSAIPPSKVILGLGYLQFTPIFFSHQSITATEIAVFSEKVKSSVLVNSFMWWFV